MAKRRLAGKIAKVKARRAYRTALRMPKKKLAKVYATKVGQTTYTVVKKRKSYGKRTRRMGRRMGRRYRR